MLHIFGDLEAYSYSYYLKHNHVKEYIIGSKTKETGDVLIATTVYEWIQKLEEHVKTQEESATVYFHNGSGYDFQFILPVILKMYPNNENKPADKQKVKIFVDDKTKIFEIKYEIYWKVYVNGKRVSKKATIKFVDSWKIWPLKLESMGKAVGLPKLDYGEYDILDEFPTVEDYMKHNDGKSYEYFLRDIDIMLMFADKTESIMPLDKYSLTMASTAMKTWKTTNEHFGKQMLWWSKYKQENENSKDTYENNVEVWETVKKAYKGGITYVKPEHQLKLLENVIPYDINSMYPGIMYNEKMPYGAPLTEESGLDDTYTYKIYKVYIEKAKTDTMPFIPKPEKTVDDLDNDVLNILKGLSNDEIVKTDYDTQYPDTLENCVVYMNNYTLDLFEECYEGSWTTEFKVAYRETYGVFSEYIDKFRTIKETSEGAVRELSKLFLNSLYGKFGQNIDNLASEVLDKNNIKLELGQSGTIHYHNGERVTVNGDVVYKKVNHGIKRNISYIAMAEAITSKARIQLVKAINDNWDQFVYCDTDSIHLLGPARNIEEHATQFGKWGIEEVWKKAVYRRPKHYYHIGTEEDENAYELKGGGFNISKFGPHNLSIEEYLKPSFIVEGGKTVSNIVDGGVVIREIDYKFSMPSNYKEDKDVE